jgi:spore coat polysaccharide biosynthesis protein SpsF (cytidylyltransferase family)
MDMLKYTKDIVDLRLTVDYKQDYELAEKICHLVYNGKPFSFKQIKKLHKKHPELFQKEE